MGKMDTFLSNIFPWMGGQAPQASSSPPQQHHQQPTPSPSIPFIQSHPSTPTHATIEHAAVANGGAATPGLDSSIRRKRKFRRTSTPALIHFGSSSSSVSSTPVVENYETTELERPVKIFRGETQAIGLVAPCTSTTTSASTEATTTPIVSLEVVPCSVIPAPTTTPLESLPEDLVAHALSFLGTVEDRFALQCTSKQFQRVSNTPSLMAEVKVGGHDVSGLAGIILETDTPETASARLTPFAVAGNLEALFMLGIIKSYCDCDVTNGVSLLKMASAQGYIRASYALGLVLRDANPDEAFSFMTLAAQAKYLPALQEILPARDMKALYGEPKAEELRRHLDHPCLNRLLSRHYINSSSLRTVNTSHCWNHLCGRWAYKATSTDTTRTCNHHNNTVTTSAASESSTTTDDSSLDASKNRVSRMKMCSRCCRAKYCSKLCQVYDWRSGRHKMECQFLS